jgi:restriction endonuclease Mrr
VLHVRECAKRVADAIGLPPETRDLALPSGAQSYIENRMAWALWYMPQAGLVVRPKRGQYQITGEGTKVLASPPAAIDNKFLSKYPSFVERVLKPKAATSGEPLSTRMQGSMRPGCTRR